MKLDLAMAADEFEMIDAETHLFYNIRTGEFDFYSEHMDVEDADAEKLDDESWIAAPSQRDIREYEIMVDFAETISDHSKSELLSVALDGSGAFRRFKDTLSRVSLEDEWYSFKRNAFIEIAREWCETNGIDYIDNSNPRKSELHQASVNANCESFDKPSAKIAVTLVTLQSHNHLINSIESGVKVYNGGGVEFNEHGNNTYWAKVPHKHGSKVVTLEFTKDGRDIKSHYCHCTNDYRDPPVCRHVIAAVLAIQNGIVETKLSLGKTATVNTIVVGDNTAEAVGSGSLKVFSTPFMIAIMEQAACKCLSDCLEDTLTSVGTSISVNHTAASPIGMEITASATIDSVFGRKVEFTVTASDTTGEIGKGKHTRIIVEVEQFLKKAEERGKI